MHITVFIPQIVLFFFPCNWKYITAYIAFIIFYHIPLHNRSAAGYGAVIGGYGAYAVGVAYLDSSVTYRVVVGKTSTDYNGGYNGGGNGSNVSAGPVSKYQGGGGATHIASVDGVLSSLSSTANPAKVLIVAGGGGGAYNYDNSSYALSGGHAGGKVGNPGAVIKSSCYSYNGTNNPAEGGKQDSGGLGNNGFTSYKGSFGKGANAGWGGAGGGSGWYGGGGTTNLGCSAESAGGGSSYIGNSLLLTRSGITKQMYCYNCTASSDANTKTTSTTNVSSTATANYAKSGNGYAKITWISAN